MNIMLFVLLGAALLAALVATVMLPKIFQRAIAMVFSVVVITLIAYTGILLKQKESEAWNYRQNIRPSNELLSLVADDIRVGRHEQAMSRLDLMRDRWKMIRARPNGYSVSEVLREMLSSFPAGQTNLKTND